MSICMKYLHVFSLFLIMLSCNDERKVPDSLREKAIQTATQYASAKLDSSMVATDNGFVSIGDVKVRYVISPENVFYAEIDENPGRDILVTIDSLHDPYLIPAWHIILNKKDRELEIVTVIRSDMRVLEIKNGIISAEIPTHKPDSPLYYCSECRDTVSYQIFKGVLNPTASLP
jgi:hypothetical protein